MDTNWIPMCNNYGRKLMTTEIAVFIYRRYKARNTLQWRHNGLDNVSNHQRHDCLLKRLYSCRSNKAPKLRVTGLCWGNSPETGEFPTQKASNAKNVSIWWRHHDACGLVAMVYILINNTHIHRDFFSDNRTKLVIYSLTHWPLWTLDETLGT